MNDYFQKLSSCWDDLSFWLDPSMSMPVFIDGFDPYDDFWETGDTSMVKTATPGISVAGIKLRPY